VDNQTQISLSELIDRTSQQFEEGFLSEMKQFSSLPTFVAAIFSPSPIPSELFQKIDHREQWYQDHSSSIDGFILERANGKNDYKFLILTAEGLFQCRGIGVTEACYRFTNKSCLSPVWEERVSAPKKLWVDHANQIIECFTAWKKKLD